MTNSGSEEDKETQELSQSPGEILAQAREGIGLSRIQVSELLGLTQGMIRDIELCRFEKFPSGIYARGYIRNYCKLVKADEAQVLAAYDRYGETNEIPEEQPFGNAQINIPKTGKMRVKTFILIGVVLFGLAVWWAIS